MGFYVIIILIIFSKKNGEIMSKTTASPKIPIHLLTTGKRVIGREVEIEMDDVPLSSLDSTRDLAGEVFWEYYSPSTPMKEDIPDERIINGKLLEWLKESPSWESSRMGSMGNSLISSISAHFLTMYLMSDDVIKEAMRGQEELEEQKQVAESMNDKADQEEKKSQEAQNNGEQEKADEMKRNAENLRKKAQKAQDKANAIKQEVEKEFEKLNQSSFSEAIRSHAIKKAQKEGNEVKSVLESLGWDNEKSENISVQDVKRLSEFGQRGIGKKFAELFGRARKVALSHKNKKQDWNGIVFEAGYTRKVDKMFPSEKAALHPNANPIIRAIKISQFCQRGLMGMMEGKPQKSHGSFIAAIDDSGSMRDNDKSLIAKALNLGLCEAAKENDQKYICFRFSSDGDGTPTITDQTEPSERLKWLLDHIGGGTSFELALKYAMDCIEQLEEEERPMTDIIITTDGMSWISKEAIARYNRMRDMYGTRLIELYIPSRYNYYWSGNQNNESGLKDITSHRIVIPDDKINIDEITEQLSTILETTQENHV